MAGCEAARPVMESLGLIIGTVIGTPLLFRPLVRRVLVRLRIRQRGEEREWEKELQRVKVMFLSVLIRICYAGIKCLSDDSRIY